jgi:hypothetical protein
MTSDEYIDLWGKMQFFDIMALRIYNGQEMVETLSVGTVLINVGKDALKQIEKYDPSPKNKIIAKLRRIKTHQLLNEEV